MPRYVALLRGVNVGGRNKVAMSDLRAVVASLGHTEVATYIQSGNVVFTGAEGDGGVLAAALEREIAGRFGVPAAVVVLSRAELAQLIADNPFPGERNPRHLHAIVGQQPVGPDGIAAVAAAQRRARVKASADEAVVVGRTVFLHTPEGFGRSELAAQLARLGQQAATGTARNWATVTRLLAMLDSPV